MTELLDYTTKDALSYLGGLLGKDITRQTLINWRDRIRSLGGVIDRLFEAQTVQKGVVPTIESYETVHMKLFAAYALFHKRYPRNAALVLKKVERFFNQNPHLLTKEYGLGEVCNELKRACGTGIS